MPFFKKDGDNLLSAPNFVVGPDFELRAESKDDYVYPVNDWYWFDTLDAALLGLSSLQTVVSITMRQARLQLLALGVYELVNSTMTSLPASAQIEWEYANDLQESNPLVLGMQELLGWSDVEKQKFFVDAAKL